MSPEVFIIALAGIMAVTLIVCVPVVMIFWLVAKRRDNRMLSGQEERLLRDTFEGLRRMEERITNLETILMDSERKQRERL
jgi:phage shock protein B